MRIYEWVRRRPQIQPPHVNDLLNPQNDIFPRGDFDNIEDDVEIVDLSVNEPNIEGLDDTANFDNVKKNY